MAALPTATSRPTDVPTVGKAATMGSTKGVTLSARGVPSVKAANLQASGSTNLVSGRSEILDAIPEPALKLHAGYLTKKGEGMMAKSQQRWFVLYRNGQIHYFEGE